MAKAKKLPSGSWRVRVCIGKDTDGKYKYKSFTDSDRKRCERMAAEYLDEHRSYLDSDQFRSCVEQYIASRKPVLSPSTIRGYNNIKKQLLTQYSGFCGLQIQDINQEKLQTLVNEMTMFVSPKTIRNRHGLITAVMKYKGYNPPYVKLPERVKPDLRVPDAEDIKHILEVAQGTEMEIPIMLAAFGPLRRGEVVALRMEDINGNDLHVCRAIVEDSDGNLIEKTPKTYDSDRHINMPSFVIDAIRKKGYIFDSNRPRMITLRFERLVKKCGLDGMRFHDLRHFCASWLHAQGVPEEYILERGGWSTGTTMKDIYRHALASETQEINKRIVSSMAETFGL